MLYHTILKDKEFIIKSKKELFVVRANGSVPLTGVFPTRKEYYHIVQIGTKEICERFVDNHVIIARDKKYNDSIVFQDNNTVVLKNGFMDNVYTLQIVSLRVELRYLKEIKCDLHDFCRLVSGEHKLSCKERGMKKRLLKVGECLIERWEEDGDVLETLIYAFVSVILCILFFKLYYS